MKPVVIQPGTLLQNRYRVSSQVGKGGMGEVYLATDERFQSKVAVKRTFYDDAEMRKAFAREARLLNRLRHPSLPQVSDHFTEGDSQFLVMEFIEGYDLGELLKQRKVPFPLADVLRWADEMLEVLDYLHRQEPPVVHRDIKPANIKLTPEGRVVLLDFGLAKGMKSQTDAGTASSVFGYSLSFAPLEQMQGSGTDPRSDLYSVAATLYFLLTAVRPVDALTRAAATVKHQPDPLRPAHLLQGQVTKEVSQILQRAMSQNSALRYASAVELRAALRQAANHANASQVLPKPANENVPEASSHVSPPLAPSLKSEPFILDGSSRRPLSNDTGTRSLRDTSSTLTRLAARPKLLFIVSLLFVSAAAAAYMIAGAASTRTPAATTGEEAEASSALNQQSAATDAKTSTAREPLAESAEPAPSSRVSQQPANVVGDTPSGSPDAASPASVNTNSNERGGGAANNSDNNSAASSQPVNKPALVIQQPAPATYPGSETRRAEEPARTQPAYQSEDINRPPPPYPPPPADRRPPPPDRRWPPPPPLRRP